MNNVYNPDNSQRSYYQPPKSVTNQPASYIPPRPIKPVRKFTVSETVFAWLSLLFGYLFCRVFPLSESPFGGFLFTHLLFVSAYAIVITMKKKPTPMAVAVSLSASVISFSLIFTSNSTIHFFAYCYALLSFSYFLYASFGNSVKKGLSDFIVADFLKVIFVMPFCSFGSIFRALFSGKGKRGGKVILRILIGLGIALIPTLIVFILLSYDSDFTNLLSDIFDFNFVDIFSHIGSVILGVPVGMYIYGLFVSSVDNKCKTVMSVDSSAKVFNNIRIAPMVTVAVAVVPVMFLYVVFFISQWKYYVSAFTNVLPDEFSYADYARNGFFELCVVSAINFVIIIAVILFLKRIAKPAYIMLRVTVIAVSLATLVLISTALAKMVMYINAYGLTQKRVYTTWFMILLAVVFILICVRLFVRSFKPVALSLFWCVIMFAILALPNVDAFIADYNVDRYINGTLDTVDIENMRDLDSSAVPSLMRLYKHILEHDGAESQELYSKVYQELYNRAEIIKENDNNVFSFTIPDAYAEKVLEKISFTDEAYL